MTAPDLFRARRFRCPTTRPAAPPTGSTTSTRQVRPGEQLHHAGAQVRHQYEHWNGVDVTVNARLQGGLRCRAGSPLASRRPTTARSGRRCRNDHRVRAPTPDDYCHVEQAFLTQVKFLATYLIPKIDVNLAATFQNNPGPDIVANYFVPAANIVGLGRPLSNGGTTVIYNLLEPNTLYGDRATQLDIRMSKIFRMGGNAPVDQLRPRQHVES